MLIGSLRSDRRGVVAVEFAMIAPLLIVLMVGVVDLSRAVIVQQEVYNAAHTIPVLASSLAVKTDGSTSLTVAQVQQSLSGIYAQIPGRRTGLLRGQAAVIMTSVNFTQTNSSCAPATSVCTFVANTAWSVAYKGPSSGTSQDPGTFQSIVRPCQQLTQTSASSNVDGVLTSIRTAGIAWPSPILVVDVHYHYTPIFFSIITGPLDFWSSGYWPVRSVNTNVAVANQYTHYDIANTAGGAGKCNGYS